MTNESDARKPDSARGAASAWAEAEQLNQQVNQLYGAGKFGEAIPLAERALAIGENAFGPNHPIVATGLNNLAAMYDAVGDYAKAEPLFQRAVGIYERLQGPEHPNVATALNNLATLYNSKGDRSKSESLHQRALSIREKALGPDHVDVGESLSHLAGLYGRKGEYATAELYFQRALSIWQKALGPEHPYVAIAHRGLALVYKTKGDYAKAEPLYERVISFEERVLGPHHPRLAGSLGGFATLHCRRGDHAKAEPLYQRALAIREKALGPNHPDLTDSLEGLAGVYQALGEHAKAMSCMGRAVAIKDHNTAILLGTGSDQQKQAYMHTLRGSTDRAVSLHIHAAPHAEEAKRLALAVILSRKGRVLDAMTDSFTALRHSLTPADRARLEELRSVSTQYSALVWRKPARMPVREYRATLNCLESERQALEADISRRSAELGGDLQPLTIAKVQAAIPEEAALVELFLYAPFDVDTWKYRVNAPRYAAYVLHRSGEIAWADLGEAEPINAAAIRLRQALSQTSAERRPTGAHATAREFLSHDDPVGDPRRAGRDLDELVMRPIRRLLGSVRRILLSPDASLNLVPFGALVDEEGHYLVERSSVTYLASGRDLLRRATNVPSRRAPVVVAAPDYDAARAPTAAHAARTRSEVSADARGLLFKPLQFAEQEGRAIANKLPGSEYLTGAGATTDAVRALAGPRVLHIATHGFLLPDLPALHEHPSSDLDDAPKQRRLENALLRSGIALAGANRLHDDQADGLLTALEVSQLDLTGTKLIVLSACRTGVGSIRIGDGVYGLRRAMVIAGAETQVMSLWSVDDAATRELMEAYYDKLQAGCGRSEAMRLAQLEMLDRADRAHPYYWASFIVSGSDAPLGST
ncbi:CHAT domain-containing tetratricopeptide repeat protein [Polyangium sp. y55x31]|uniref:CHAT domain-containing tetratricopeptide repeat protein n=1 Tax=Polyangium sp. y55x31 TaxID=3042688 RepID=UPI00248235A2|nr:CHAT domain-containing tetratricopeptide repeat protein [Polyangium sp. y55x31]MDI1478932.1 CHAT domain-containing protein [Polyangium sp. y55x31]